MLKYATRYNPENNAWEVIDTETNTVYESFSCKPEDELRHYAESRALAHAARLNGESKSE